MRMWALAAGVIVAMLAGGPAFAQGAAPVAGEQCPDDFGAFKDEPGPLACTCPAEATTRGSVWGTDVYTTDSAVCRAAMHAGRVGRGGGPVVVQAEPGRRAYPGTTRNGVQSSNYGPYESSFRFAGGVVQASVPVIGEQQCPDNYMAYKDDPTPLTCACPAEATRGGSVWGSDVYTGDSALCRAALHAGRVPRAGGTVTVVGEAGRAFYPGVTRNGVASTNYRAYGWSFRFAGDVPAGAAQCPDNYAAYMGETDPLTCSCPAEMTRNGSVWGTDVYTADSVVCRAAVHSGRVRAAGGAVTVVGEPGRRAYPGTTRNGVRSDNYGPYEWSFRFDGPIVAAAAAPAGPSAPMQCPDNAVAFKDETAPIACICPAEATQRGSLWGTDGYTADSGICRAALHAGRITRQGGAVTLVMEPGRRAYAGTTRNGVRSDNYGPYEAGFRIEGPVIVATAAPAAPSGPAQCPDNAMSFKDETAPIACICPAEATQRGSLWGTDVYTADSGICRAALHAGMVTRLGGPVTVAMEPGRRAYAGTTRNGMRSDNYGPYEASFRLTGTPAVAGAAPVQAAIGDSLRASGKVNLYVQFRTGSADLDISSAPVLAELLGVLRAEPSLRLALIGHTDSQGTRAINGPLSVKRAGAVREWLVGQGVDGARLTADGRGQEEPIAPNTTEEGRALNRRVAAALVR